jgi:hypothetical protein
MVIHGDLALKLANLMVDRIGMFKLMVEDADIEMYILKMIILPL